MSKAIISMIFAMDQNRLIGKNNDLPWHIPDDMAYFKRTTEGHSVLMGRKTYESFGSKPLPRRQNIIMTQNRQFTADGCAVIHTVEEALKLISETKDEEFFIIGGSEIYKLFMPHADRLYITHIEAAFEGDAYFPDYNEAEWKEIRRVKGVKDEKNPYDYYYTVYERVQV